MNGANNTLRSITIPKLGNHAFFKTIVLGIVYESLQIIHDAQTIGTLADGNRTLRIRPQGQAGDAQIGGFFLDAPGIGDEQSTIKNQTHETAIGNRFFQVNSIGPFQTLPQAVLFQTFLGAWMDGKQQWYFF